ncbi:Fatty acid oxidation complex subunit alpha [Pirellulimonas nuda]|uniref:enoyl-CoA hydratase n=1 Tax=Pirellulimonas nuda TaxID=2528009 RepID=A0A518DJD1_9BACT|nr:3-hydroxyacyl-CoA dehydrogenase NAD-binding domain-containing protein [Pirellulimonas nuda]QDU91594.1 Fatty acid oxidation complex subunit alpha [Pirellulimonas nuda]
MASAQHTRLEFDGPVALLTLDHAQRSANLLSSDVLDEIEAHLDTLAGRDGVQGLVFLSAKPGVFIAGADLAEFAAGLDRPKDQIVGVSRRGQTLFARLAEAPYVSVAAIDGVCVGGGAELAVWCDRRLMTASSKSQFGFPEVKLGLFPGWGGTARTPRMVGLGGAVELVTGGESIGAAEAYKLGLVSAVVTGDLLAAAKRLIEAEQESGQYLADRQRWAGPVAMDEAERGFLGVTAGAYIQQQTGGHYPAPLAALELMLEAAPLPLDEALKLEAESFAPLFGSKENRALLNVFFLQDRAKKTPPAPSPQPPAPARVSVLGAGVMGQGIAAAHARRGIPVLLADSRPEALANGIAGVVGEASYDKALGGPSAARAIEMAALVGPGLSDEALAESDIVIEAIYEDLRAKRELLGRLAPLAADDALLCSNTSTIPITQLAQGLPHPERFCGLHFFNPVRKMPLVEVIRGAETSDATVAQAAAHARRIGKTPVVVADGPGFLVNRLLLPYMNEAALMAEEGVPIRKIEGAAKRFGMPMGPLTLFDVVGLDVATHAGGVMAAAFPDRMQAASIVPRLVEADRLGQKNGRGFFDYPSSKPGKTPRGEPSAEVDAMLEVDSPVDVAELPYDLADRLLLPMLLEATRAIEDGIVADVRDVDLALILGIGFPPHKGGLFFWADQVGADAILQRLETLTPLGSRFEPTAMLQETKRFYE